MIYFSIALEANRPLHVQALSFPCMVHAARSTSHRKSGKASSRNESTSKRGRKKSNNPINKETSTTIVAASTPNKKPNSLGEAVQQAQTVPELLQVASKFWLPTDEDLPSHLQTQVLHHERRQRWGAQLIGKLSTASLHSAAQVRTIWQDERFARAVSAAALPFPSDSLIPVNDKDLRTLREALLGLHSLVGHVEEKKQLASTHPDILQGIQQMLKLAETNAYQFVLPEAMEVRWAARGLIAQLGQAVAPMEETNNYSTSNLLASSFPQLDERVDGLPFDILPRGVDFSNLTWLGEYSEGIETQGDIMTSLQQSIPFHFDTIVTRRGDRVLERRGTAWVAEEGIGALAYSGKLMSPSMIPPLVRRIMEEVERAIDTPQMGFFDCALCNYYPEGEAACKFHFDPEHGTMWERLNCVVSVGDSRRFAFRPIPDQTSWSEWDSQRVSQDLADAIDSGNAPAVIRLFPGDIVSMFANCNDRFHHAVYPESESISSERGAKDLRRISLVLKRAIANGNKGRKGHGLAGEGRRSRRKRT